jgi:iron complex outermembrane recepter protein
VGFTVIDYLIGGIPNNIPGGSEAILSSNREVEIPRYTNVESRFRSTNFTFAGRYSPFEGVVLRGSYATGFLPPSVVQIASQTVTNPFGLQMQDPLRGNEFAAYPITQTQGIGSTSLRPEKSTTLSAGVILTPFDGLRLSADYTRIRKKDEIGTIPLAFLLANPDLFPDRVVRGPASDGFAVGRVVSVDLTPINLLKSRVEAVDFQADYRLRTREMGEFRFYGVATWQPDTVRQLIVAAPATNYTGNIDGPLEWQGNVGLDWTLDNLSIRWNTQFYDSYKIYFTTDSATQRASRVTAQGAESIPSQSYSDLYMSYDFKDARGLLNQLRISAGVQNIFDKRPPVIGVSGFLASSYSTYGDPRLRRFTVSLRKTFGNR